MRFAVVILLVLAASVTVAAAPVFVTVADQARLPLVAGWEVVGDTTHYPLQLVYNTGEAELLVYRSDIEELGAVDDDLQLRQATNDVIQDVILTLPDAQMLKSTGYYETSRTGFVLEFTSYDSVMHARLNHRLKTALYRTKDGNQIMFTMWGKGLADSWEHLEGTIEFMQQEFEYTGAHADQVFLIRRHSFLPYVLLVVALASIYLLIRRHLRGRRVPSRPAG